MANNERVTNGQFYHELPSRVKRLQKKMRERHMDAIIVFKPEHSFYLSGFNPIIYSKPVIVVLVPDQEPVLLVHALRDEHARASTWLRDIRFYGIWGARKTLGTTWQDALVAVMTDLKVVIDKTVGVEEDYISMKRSRELQKLLPRAHLVDASTCIHECRLVKDADEIANARIAGKIADVGMEAMVAALARGATEREASINSMHEMNKFWAVNYPDVEVADFGSAEGGQHNGCAAWALAGSRKYYSCDNPTNYQPQPGETVATFVWTVANGMHSEIERLICIGPVPDADKKAVEDILEIRSAVDALLKPGTPVRDLYLATQREFETREFGEHVPGRIGHAVGLGPHEHVSINAQSTLVLEPGMILTLEPNFDIVGVLATQFSDTFLITDTGREYLTHANPGYIEI